MTISSVPMIRMDVEELAFKYAGDSTGNNLLGKLGEKILQRCLGRGEREAIMRWVVGSPKYRALRRRDLWN